jgi:hypothetical protein
MASARDGDFDPERWWEKRGSVKAFAMEIEGMVVTIWELNGKAKRSKGEAGGGVPAKASRENWAVPIQGPETSKPGWLKRLASGNRCECSRRQFLLYSG